MMRFPNNILYRVHAIRRMFERDISDEAIKAILKDGLIIQKYADDKPYPSYLLGGEYENRPIHVVISVNQEEQTTIIITAYIPDPTEWKSDFMERRKK